MTSNSSGELRTDSAQAQVEMLEFKKSRVRVCVTYAMTGTYIFGALGLISCLMWKGETQLALGVFSGVASTTTAVFAFWFGARGSARSSAPKA